MDNTELFVVMDGTLMFATVVILSLLGMDVIDVYLGLFAAELFISSEVNPPVNSTESRKRFVMGAVMIAIFVGAILKRIMLALGA